MDFPFSRSLSSCSHLVIAMIGSPKLETHSRSIDAGDVKEIECEAITEAEVTVFEGAWLVGDVKMEITVSKAGDVLSQEKSLKLDQLPESLRTMATKFAGKDELKLEAKTVLLYELEVVRNGKTIEILVDATGREIKVIVGEDEDEDEEDDENEDEDEDDK